MRRAILLLGAGLPLWAQGDPQAFYQTKVRPVLQANCLACHNQQLRTSGLALDSRTDLLTGGNRGAAAKPGAPNESLLIKAVEQTGDLKMPPGKKLTDEQIGILRTWIEQGIAFPAAEQTQKKKGWDHWAFQPLKSPPVPAVRNRAWVRNEIDNFILARLEKEGVRPSAEADRSTLLRRVSLDLTGLPPSPQEIQEFLNDRSPNAYEKVVDRLLASPHYAEREARHWLDLARYADSDGYTIDDPRQIWRYRDWVIRALDRDQPFNQFVIEQIAGDLLPNPTVDQLVATGFHRNTPSNFEGGIDQEQYRIEAVADRVATTGSVFLGLTLGCARCHDHKYDPIAQREFYQLLAYYNNTEAITQDVERTDHNRPRLELPTPEEEAKLKVYREQVAAVNRELVGYVRALSYRVPEPGDPAKHQDPGLLQAVNRLRAARRQTPRVTYTLIMHELDEPRPAFIHLGGDFTRPGAPVSPGVPAVLTTKPVGTSRLDLANWLVDPDNPLPARVTMNRMWQAYFGKGIVETENDFGLIGSRPTHPELLDWLGAQFIARGWSLKTMHRLMVTSATYRQSSYERKDLEEKDPYNNLLARQTRLRLDAEVVRDASLVASGLLTPAVGGPSVFAPMPSGAMGMTQVPKPWPTEYGPDRYRRGLYTFTYRSSLHPSLGVFDAPDGATSCTRRVRSNNPLQALTLLNDTAHVEFAIGLAERVLKQGAATDRARLDDAFLLALGRKPRPAELARVTRFLSVQRDQFQTKPELARQLLRNERAAREAEQVSNVRSGGAQSGIGRADTDAMFAKAPAVKAAAQKALAAHDGLSEKQAVELAAWTAVSRVLLNVDDFITRN